VDDDASPAGRVYQSTVSALLAAEFERRKTLDGRGSTLLTASSTLLTLIFGLTVLVTGKDAVFADKWAVGLLIGALLAFVSSAVFAIVTMTYGFKYKVPSCDSLKDLAGTNEAWAKTADHAVRADVSQLVTTICSLRPVNRTKADLVTASLVFQMLALAMLSASVGCQLNAMPAN
jgi:hypothetical protein